MCWSAPRRASRPRAWPAGAFAKLMLRELGIEVASHVIRVGRVELERDGRMGRDCRASAAETRSC